MYCMNVQERWILGWGSINIYLNIRIISNVIFIETILVHDPVGLLAVRGASSVKDECLSHPNSLAGEVDRLVPPRGLPKPSSSGSICASPSRIFFVLVTEKIPLVLRARSYLTFF